MQMDALPDTTAHELTTHNVLSEMMTIESNINTRMGACYLSQQISAATCEATHVYFFLRHKT